MKKSYTLIILLLIAFAACKKDQAPSSTDLKTQMIGKWNLDSYVYNQYDPDGNVIKGYTTTYTGKDGDYIIFNSNGTATQYSSGINTSSNSTFSINSDTMFTFADAKDPTITTPCKVVSITPNSFIFISEGTKLPNSMYTGITCSYKR